MELPNKGTLDLTREGGQEKQDDLAGKFQALVQHYWERKDAGAGPEELAPIKQKIADLSNKDKTLIDQIKAGMGSMATPAWGAPDTEEPAARPAPVTGDY